MNDLDILARKYGTDKQTNEPNENKYHGYTTIYHNLLNNYREEFQHVLEIGVREGWSHQMWYEYFPKAIIYGIDNASERTHEELKSIENDRIKIFIGDQSDECLLEEVSTNKEFDLIIDDGSHFSWHHQKTFKKLFWKLKPGGFYIFEDLGVCGIRSFREYDDIRSATNIWLKNIQQGNFFSYYIEDGEIYLKEIESIQIIGELGIIKKRKL